MKETIKITGFIQEDKSIVVKIPQGKYIINDEYTEITGYNGLTITCSSPFGIKKVEHTRVLSAYKNIETDEIIKIEDFLEAEKCLLKKRREIKSLDEDDDEYISYRWETLDDEFEYKKFISKWKSIYKEYTDTVGEIEVNLQKKMYSSNPYIKPISHFGKAITNNLFTFTSPISILHDLGEKFKFDHVGDNTKYKDKNIYSYPTHSELRYLKINGHYVINDMENKLLFRTITGTFEECEDVYNSIYKLLEKKFLIEKNNNVQIAKQSAAMVLSKLKNLYSLIWKIDYKQKSSVNFNMAIKCVSGLIDEVEKIIMGTDNA